MTTTTQTLTHFLLGRIADDEAVARKAWARHGNLNSTLTAADEGGVIAWPSRVLAECRAWRAIIELHADGEANCMGGYAPGLTHGDVIRSQSVNGVPNGYCDTLRALASIYADHESFDPRWAL